MRIVQVRPAARCAVCHDELDARAVACLGCASVGHAACVHPPVRVWTWWPELFAALGLALLVGLVWPLVRPRNRTVERVRADMRALHEALELYRRDVGALPLQIQELWERPAGAVPWSGPYLKEWPPRDPWGNEYLYSDGSYDAGEPEWISYGADGAPGGQDETADLSSRTINNADTSGR